MDARYIAVVTTVGSADEARKLARELVEQKLAACAQISQIESFYTWDGTVQNDPEFRVLFKTLAANYTAMEAAIKARHSYELPAIHALALEPIYAPYAQWIADNASGG